MANHSDEAAANAEAAAATAQPTVNDHLLQQQLFWAAQLQEIKQIRDFRVHSLPISRVKKIMKSDKDVHMISAEAPILIAKACELFIQELTHRSWLNAQEYQRRTLKKTDFITVLRETELFDFLVDAISMDETEEEVTGFVPGMLGNIPSGIPYCYSPMGPPAPPIGPPAPSMGPPAAPRGIMGRRAMPWVAPSVHVPPPLYPRQSGWHAAGGNPYATGGSSGQGNGDPQS
ncbi:nuclear transcription factor Y subunit C-1-like [Solanum stenotomum]|uniref:nuclear transcription factor Y subunit C-1-like n=1 Tax=Solanum stenotomum TaxID=172797 RepID=UPI0020D1D262|nr:nuclear transcription factor Y subunit C-1-like [Solanum stenotomum]XP_049396082.1 nuclear transcription factor Y subunit C-1-like [Solanum stenotomum]XP_049396083.1 nuclear transcription factor Y subunit C-1-like [Solanum stenotomum]XP_049396084.1 nuclear transcription factor Y subunit C-1-like [Solanum stenotomum]XP_049396085.1 nuclear transcription factor Y subunit C-1-like [Solanum stenotomum]XP_049396086.1 nuclear transcription factor Y subunit C-1-like [Solanum stenotomum]XP_04939608